MKNTQKNRWKLPIIIGGVFLAIIVVLSMAVLILNNRESRQLGLNNQNDYVFGELKTSIQYPQQSCHLQGGNGRILIDFHNKGLCSHKRTDACRDFWWQNANIPAGKYKVYLESYDGYGPSPGKNDGREHSNPQDQKYEQYYVEFYKGNAKVATSGTTPDLQDGVREARFSGIVNNELNIPQNTTKLLLKHKVPYPNKPNSLRAICMMLEPISPTCTLSFDKSNAKVGESVTLSSTANNATTGDLVCTGPTPATINNNPGLLHLNNPQDPFTSAGTEHCELTVRNDSGQAGTCEAEVVVTQEHTSNNSVGCGIHFTPSTIYTGDTSTFSWNSTNAQDGTFTCDSPMSDGQVHGFNATGTPLSGSKSYIFDSAGVKSCTMRVHSATGLEATCNGSIHVIQRVNNPTCALSFDKSNAKVGESVTLSSTANNATTGDLVCTGPTPATINNNPGLLHLNNPQDPFTSAGTEHCELTVRNDSGQAGTCEAEVVVTQEQGGSCGNGTVEGDEKCDLGTANNGKVCVPEYGKTCTYCDDSCQEQTVTGGNCGNGTREEDEKCDDGDDNGKIPTVAYGKTETYCKTDCTVGTVVGGQCGNGTREGDEECDDGNTTNGDGCNSICQVEEEKREEKPDCNSSIGNYIWYDTNGNGIQEDIEEGIEGIKVCAFRGNKKYCDTTNKNGKYEIEDLCEGTYTVVVKDVDAMTQTFDPDGKKDNKTKVKLKNNDKHTKADFGYRGKAPSTGLATNIALLIGLSTLITIGILLIMRKKGAL